MTPSEPSTTQEIRELVMANRAIRAPDYRADRSGRRWGDDIIPALMGLFRVEEDPGDDHRDGRVGFARHCDGETLRLDFDLAAAPEESDPILVLTAISGREAPETARAIEDEDFGRIELPERTPTREEWGERSRRYQAARSADDADQAAAVKAYIAALPGWKRAIATRIDELIEREVPDVRRAVKWHIPFWGLDGRGWFASIAAFSKHVKLTFIQGASLDPMPPREHPEGARAVDLKKSDTLDEDRLASWIRQAVAVPGEWGP